ncbi:MAG TPA: 2,5-dihydroxypyridine 5,6-dioxygenase [Pseudorhodoferax sp.]|jgi:2,5-dihydroxypyridine 5,6-dioxygenase|nr:2,5-dihydroxypyridine 5,6-dioxygenase [Pseudorhodoferax sp.]
MPVSDHQLTQAWSEVLRLSKLQRGQTVTILTGAATHPQTLRAATLAAQAAGAVVSRIDLPPVNADKALSRDALAYLGETPLTGNPAAIAALKASDLVLDLMTLLFSPEQIDILESGTKILLAVEPPEVLVRTVPTEADRARVLAASTKLRKAKTMHVMSEAGTDVTFQLGEFPTICEYGFVDEPGRWDHWPSGFLFTFANEGGSKGTIVVDTGDIVLPQKSYANSPIRITVENGYARAIEGGIDAQLLSEYMATFQDPEAYAMSHIGWGLQPRCHWSTLAMYDKEQTIAMDARAFEGNFLFSLGPNNEAGGQRTTACHIDIPLRNCTVSLDGEVVVREGKVLDGGGA